MGGWHRILVRVSSQRTQAAHYDSSAYRQRYTYSSVFATQLIAAASFTEYWGLAQVFQTVFFYIIIPIAILAVNFAGVFVCCQLLCLDSWSWLNLPTVLRSRRNCRWLSKDLYGPRRGHISLCHSSARYVSSFMPKSSTHGSSENNGLACEELELCIKRFCSQNIRYK